MENFDMLIEKYKNDLLKLSKKKPITRNNNFEKAISESMSEIKTEYEETNENEKSAHFGSLKVSVYSGNEAFPVETALVEVFDENERVLYRLFTDSGGIAEGLILHTPSKKENDSPGGKNGFSVYKLRVSHPDYETQFFDDVVVYEGVESIQQVFLQPLNEAIPEEDSNGGY